MKIGVIFYPESVEEANETLRTTFFNWANEEWSFLGVGRMPEGDYFLEHPIIDGANFHVAREFLSLEILTELEAQINAG